MGTRMPLAQFHAFSKDDQKQPRSQGLLRFQDGGGTRRRPLFIMIYITPTLVGQFLTLLVICQNSLIYNNSKRSDRGEIKRPENCKEHSCFRTSLNPYCTSLHTLTTTAVHITEEQSRSYINWTTVRAKALGTLLLSRAITVLESRPAN